MQRLIALVILVVILAACATYDVQTYARIEQSSKTITVPAGSQGLTGKIKQALVNDGWKLSVYSGPTISEGAIGEKTRIEQYDTFNTRYRLLVTSRQFDVCLNFSAAIRYDISVVDNKSGSEVFTLSGSGCESTVVEKFMQSIRR